MTSRVVGGASLVGLALVACAGGVAPEAPPPAPAEAAPTASCRMLEAVPCLPDLVSHPDEIVPAREGALLWTRFASSGTMAIAVFPDGTAERTSVPRTLGEALSSSTAVVRARLSTAALEEVRAAVAALEAHTRETAQAFAVPVETSRATLLVTPSGPACIYEAPGGASDHGCVSDAAARVNEVSIRAMHALETAWRSGTYGTVALRGAVTVKGDWALGEARAEDGPQRVTAEEVAALRAGDVFRLPNGDFAEIEAMFPAAGDVYVTRHTSVRLDDEVADVREALLADADRWQTSRGAWLGVPVASDRFARFKNRGMAVLPDGRVFRHRATERLDLTAEVPVDLPPPGSAP